MISAKRNLFLFIITTKPHFGVHYILELKCYNSDHQVVGLSLVWDFIQVIQATENKTFHIS